MISIHDIKQARQAIKDVAHTTPVLTSETLNEHSGRRILLKAEHLQKTGSFKIRGATNKVKDVVRNEARHVIAASSGNHGQAVAYIANQLGVRATIVIPEDAVPVKENAIRAYGANVEYGGTTSATRLQRAGELAAAEGAVFVPPYDDGLVMAGQGTAGLEILEQVPDADAVYVPVGGGGLISGIATAIKETRPKVRLIGVEPEAAADTRESLQAGHIIPIEEPATIADGLRSLQPGDQTFPVMQAYLDDLVLVSEKEIQATFSFLLERTKQLVEPSGAVAVAAALANKGAASDECAVAVISGGNIALDRISVLAGQA